MVYAILWWGMACYMVWLVEHDIDIVWPGKVWHGIWYGLVGMAWYMVWPGEVWHGI